jgi:hypothetical protein
VREASLRSLAEEVHRGAGPAGLSSFPGLGSRLVPSPLLKAAEATVCHQPLGHRLVRGSGGRGDTAVGRSAGMRLLLPFLQGWRPVRSTRDTWSRGVSGNGGNFSVT